MSTLRTTLRWLVAPVAAELTYRRYVHLLLGAVVALPYAALAFLFATAVVDGGLDPFAFVLLLLVGGGIGIGVAVAPGVRTLEIAAARALLGASIPDQGAAESWASRWRAVVWLVTVIAAGLGTALASLAAVPIVVALLIGPWRAYPPLPTGLAGAWTPLLAPVVLVLLLRAVSSAGAGLAALAPRLIGPSPTERMAAELAKAQQAERTLAERNRLARELHDSVGHALTVTTLQAGAAARVLDTDPEFVAKALDAIAEAGRTALEELDHVIGLLREGDDGPRRAPQPDLGDLDALLASTRSAGVDVAAQVEGSPQDAPPAVSREAYRIVQEGLTNALRHAGPVPVAVRVAMTADAVELELTNPLGAIPPAPGGGRGLAGMRERVGVLRGELTAGPDGPDGPDGQRWRVAARLPLDGRG